MSPRVLLTSLLVVLLSTVLVSSSQLSSLLSNGLRELENKEQDKTCAALTDELRASEMQVAMLQLENENLRRQLETKTEEAVNNEEGSSLQETTRLQLQEYNVTKNWAVLRSSLNTAMECEVNNVCAQLLGIPESDNSPLYRVGFQGMLELATLLVNTGHAESVYDRSGENMLYGAAENGHTQLVDMLLDNGAFVDPSFNEWNSTPLIRAAHKNSSDTAKVLVRWGANVNFSDKYGVTALHFAAENGNMDLVRFLVNAGANTAAVDQNGKTPLDRADSQGHVAVVEYLSQLSQ